MDNYGSQFDLDMEIVDIAIQLDGIRLVHNLSLLRPVRLNL
jgi:hypothetical protein